MEVLSSICGPLLHSCNYSLIPKSHYMGTSKLSPWWPGWSYTPSVPSYNHACTLLPSDHEVVLKL